MEWNDKPMCETMIRLPSNYHYALLKIYTRTRCASNCYDYKVNGLCVHQFFKIFMFFSYHSF